MGNGLILAATAEQNLAAQILPVLWYIGICLAVGWIAGKSIDIQYREPEGKPHFVTIPESKKWMFRFRYWADTTVVREALWIELAGYGFAAAEVMVMILTTLFRQSTYMDLIGIGVLFAFVLVVMVILTPMALRYGHHVRQARDFDWVTQILCMIAEYRMEQQILSKKRDFTKIRQLADYPAKRRCKVVAQIDSDTYLIVVGFFGRKRRPADAKAPAQVGAKAYAIYTSEKKSPHWTIYPL